MSTASHYICLSGGEGSGKTTVLERIRADFPSACMVREPGGTPFGVTMRTAILDRQYVPNPWTELFLFMADRMEVHERLIRPALASGQTVISDRCWIETLVYQVLKSSIENRII
jgi:dTMP kinase